MTADRIPEFLADVRARLDHGAREYGDQSFVRPVATTQREILEEQIDQVGWLYVLWCQAARKTALPRNQEGLRATYLKRLEHRVRRNDRRKTEDGVRGAFDLMCEIEVLALDLFLQGEELRRRLHPICRAIEVAQLLQPDPLRSRKAETKP